MAAPIRYRVILVGVDFSEPSRLALVRATDLGRRLGARVEVVHVAAKLEPTVPFSRQNRNVIAQLQQEELDAARRQLARFVSRSRGVDMRTSVFVGTPHKVLLAYARQVRADLIVVANRGRSLGEKLLIGSTADRVLRKTRVPVLLVPPVRAPAAASEGPFS